MKEYEIKIDQMDKHIKTQDDEIKTLKEKVDTLMGNDTYIESNIFYYWAFVPFQNIIESFRKRLEN